MGAEFVLGMAMGAATVSMIACSSGSGQAPGSMESAGGSGADASMATGGSSSSGGTASSGSATGGPADAASQGADGTMSGSGSGGSGAAGLDASGGSDSAGNQETGNGTAGSANDGGGSGTTVGGTDAAAPGGNDSGVDGGWVSLFNGTDLTGFNPNCNATHTTSPPTITGAAAAAFFAAENGMIHVYPTQADQSTQPLCLLTTVASYTNFNLSWEYQWGSKKFAPYTDFTTYPRDAGVLWSLFGDVSQIWPSSIEFQNKWGTTGDIFALFAQCKSLGSPGDPTTYAPASAGGTEMTVNGSTGFVQHHRSANYELTTLADGGGVSANGYGTGWNSCLLQANAGVSTYTVNGHVVNQTLGIMQPTAQASTPVLSGPLGWQAESSEVYYRNLQIQVLP